MKNLTERLTHILKEKNMSQTELAKLISVKPQVIQYLCSSKAQSSRFTFEIAQALDVNPEWLATGKKPIYLPTSPTEAFLENKALIPIFDFTQLSLLEKNNFHFDAVPHNNMSIVQAKHKSCFGLIMPDNSMFPIFNNGAVLVINPNEELKINDYGLIQLVNENVFLIRKLTLIDNRKHITPINTTLFKEAPISNQDKIIGKIIEGRNSYE